MRESILPPEYRASHLRNLILGSRSSAKAATERESGLEFDWDAVYSETFGRYYLGYLYELLDFDHQNNSMDATVYCRMIDSLLAALLAEAWGIDLEGLEKPLDTPQGP